MGIKTAFIQLSSCWGCYQSFVNAGPELADLLSSLEIVYWPYFYDYKLDALKAQNTQEIDIGFCEGHVRTVKDIENLKLMREKCKILVSIGTCACYGSVAGLANLYKYNELLATKFENQPTIDGSKGVPKENVPPFEEAVSPVDNIVSVDIKIPGCPPRTENITALMTFLTNAQPFLHAEPSSSPACDKCTLKGDGCLLNKNSLCYGCITGSPSRTFTPTPTHPVLGDYGPTKVLSLLEVHKLKTLLNDRELTEGEIKRINEFALLYFQLPNFGFIDFSFDILAKLGTSEEPFPVVKTEGYPRYDIQSISDKQLNEIMGLIFYKLKKSPHFRYSIKNACDSCKRERVEKSLSKIKRDFEGIPDPKRCILEQGYICMGPVTRAGCGTICPNEGNAPCLGCYGPPACVPDTGAAMIGTLAAITKGMDGKALADQVKDPAGLFYRFTSGAGIIPSWLKEGIIRGKRSYSNSDMNCVTGITCTKSVEQDERK